MDNERPCLFQEIKELGQQISGPWLLVGDFNSIKYPQERSTYNISANKALFNDSIREVSIQEIPLLDCSFTWSNLQSPPVHSILDRFFINASWDDILPDCNLISLPRTTSDHFPLRLEVASSIPKPNVFRYYNVWKFKPGFKDLVASHWPLEPVHSDVAGSLGSKLKTLRKKVEIWKKSLQPDRAHLNAANQTLELIDWIEELCQLSTLELTFRSILKKKISSLIQLVAIIARQIGKVTWCVLGDENT
jgi:hypothetical protein